MRGQMIKQMLAEGVFAVEPRFLNSLIDTVNNGDIKTAEVSIDDVTKSHSYEVVDNVAVITIDGATTKKNTWMNAMCGGYIGYDTIAKYIAVAEADNKIKTIMFHLDTVGGDVAGVDTLQELIKTSTKETVTLYDNVGASAGIWYGTASDKIFATPMTQLGSIGVMAGYYEPREDDKKVVLVSRNAKNKNCLLNGDCKDKFQARIDEVEETFHARVVDNTGLTKEEILSHFNYGDVISSDKALEIGFLDGIISKKALLTMLKDTPPSEIVKFNQNGNGKISTQGQSMTVTEKLEAANSTIDTLKVDIDGKDAVLKALTDSNEELLAKVDDFEALLAGAKAEADAKLEAKQDLFVHIMSMGFEMGASKSTMLKIAKAESKEAADALMMAELRSQGVTFSGESREQPEADSGWSKVVKKG